VSASAAANGAAVGTLNTQVKYVNAKTFCPHRGPLTNG
jgi:hypothetical protein